MITTTVVLLIHVFLALGLIGLILLQHGKGADAGAAFGSGASATMFGSQGSASFMSRATKWLAILFFITSGALAYLSQGAQAPTTSVMEAEESVMTTPAEDEGDMPPVSEEPEAAAEQGSEVPAVESSEEPTEEPVEDDKPPKAGENGDGGKP